MHGVRVEKVKTNHFVMGLTRVQSLIQLYIKLKKQKKPSFALANKLTIDHSVMDHIVNNKKRKY
jgi:hypothetical protein